MPIDGTLDYRMAASRMSLLGVCHRSRRLSLDRGSSESDSRFVTGEHIEWMTEFFQDDSVARLSYRAVTAPSSAPPTPSHKTASVPLSSELHLLSLPRINCSQCLRTLRGVPLRFLLFPPPISLPLWHGQQSSEGM